MKLLFLTQYFPPEIGAPQTRLQAMTYHLRELGHQVEVVTALPNYPNGRIFPGYHGTLYRREIINEIVIHRVWLYAALGGGLARMLNYASFSLTALIGLFAAEKPDYVFVESPPLSLTVPAYLYSRMKGTRFILNVADLWPDTAVEMGFVKEGFTLKILRWLEKWSYQKAAYVNAVTESIREVLLKEKNVPLAKTLFLPNGVDTARYRPQSGNAELKQALGLTGKKVILYAGTQGHAHGLEHVLSAAKILEAEQDIHFLFVGHGSERLRLEELQKQMGLKNVTFRNPVPLEQLPPYFSIAESGLASLRAIPIFDGARPSKMFPVMASGKPMIYAGKGEGAELIERAKAGVVVPPENPEALAKAVSRVVRDSQFAQQMGANGRKFVEEHHQWSVLVRDWVDTLAQSNSKSASNTQLSH